ncbi:MAG: leucine--tRNA ligase [Bacteroidia bacterium]
MEPNFTEIAAKWQKKWAEEEVYKVSHKSDKPKYYVLDMFPYPSGAGLHVGHPLGYIASDIVSRYKRLKGFNVLHPMGFDAFGLPAEQYAIQTGRHPADTTRENIARYKEQLNNIGFCYDWSREVITSDPSYHKWTQWIFLNLFSSWFNLDSNTAEDISVLEEKFGNGGSAAAKGACSEHEDFTASQWISMTEKEQRGILMKYRLAYQDYATVNWCEALGTVLANDEVKDGLSERGGHPVEKKQMRQWFLRITAYAERLLGDLENLDWTDSMKEMQKNWIGKSEGASLRFELSPSNSMDLTPDPSPQERGGDLPQGFSAQERGENSSVAGGSSLGYGTKFHLSDSRAWSLFIPRAKKMRSEMTPSESIVWKELRDKKIGFKFRRQHIIDQFIVDFVCLSKMLIVEIDGSIHDSSKEYDEGRSEELAKLGFEVIRFTNDEVNNDLPSVISKIKEVCSNRATSYLDDQPNIGIVEEEGEEYSFSHLNERSNPLPPNEGRAGMGYIEVFTTRPDTIFGVSFLTLAPEHELVEKITSKEQKEAVEAYVQVAKNRSERERMSEVKRISGVFTGAYAIHPFSGEKIPVWIGDYVLAGYGTGAVMAVPCGDQRDWDFAKHFGLPIPEINEGVDISEAADPTKEAKMINSDFLNGSTGYEAMGKAIAVIEEKGFGKGKVNFRLRDAGFSRQRYWGEPFPIIYKDEVAYPLDPSELPLELPIMEDFKPTGKPESPLSKANDWVLTPKGMRETDTMPGYAGSSWYFLRYMDAKNPDSFVGKEAESYWQDVDLYIGGTEHAVGHLLYARFWQKFLFDRGFVSKAEPFKKLINQGMILGRSNFVYRVVGTDKYISKDMLDAHPELKTNTIHVDVNIVQNDILNTSAFKTWRDENKNAEFIFNAEGNYLCGVEVEKMSKSKYNVVNPDDIISYFGADTLRMYEMFLGPLEQSKPWNTNGIEGVHRFLKKLWNLFFDDQGDLKVQDSEPTENELRTLHKTIKKVEEDVERFSFNTSVSTFMICVNELSEQKCKNRRILKDLLITLSPYAPHTAEELWHALGEQGFVVDAIFPKWNEDFIKESSISYPIAFNGKTRFNVSLAADMPKQDVEATILAHEDTIKWLDGASPKKIIVVPGRMVNIVI